MDELAARLLNEYIVLMSVAAWFIVWVIQKVFPVINTNFWAKKLKPLYPALLCQGFVWIPGAVEDGTAWGSRVLIAFWCGFLASIGYQVAKRVAAGRGIELPDDPNKLVGNGDQAPKPEEKPEEKKPADEATPAETPAAKASTPPPADPEKKDDNA